MGDLWKLEPSKLQESISLASLHREIQKGCVLNGPIFTSLGAQRRAQTIPACLLQEELRQPSQQTASHSSTSEARQTTRRLLGTCSRGTSKVHDVSTSSPPPREPRSQICLLFLAHRHITQVRTIRLPLLPSFLPGSSSRLAFHLDMQSHQPINYMCLSPSSTLSPPG